MIFIQDIKGRSVYWILFPLLVIALVWLRLLPAGNMVSLWQPLLINWGFMVLQLLLISYYFSVRDKKFVNITSGLLGIGDILFLLSIAFYLSVLNYLFFYIISLLVSLLAWIIWQALVAKKSKHIPLAGLQAIVFILFLTADWWGKLFDLADDAWLLNLISK